MSSVTLFLARLIGATFIVMAAMFLARGKDIVPRAKRMILDPGALMISGAARTVLGLAIVIGHDEWSSGLAIAVTLFGWLLLFSGLLLLFASEERILRLVEAMNMERHLTAYAGGMAVVGLLFLASGYMG